MPTQTNLPAAQVQQAMANTQAAKTVKSILNEQNCKAKFADVLGAKAPGFISSVIQVSNQPSLIGADPKTVVAAAMVAATLDLPVNNNLGFAYIVPYNDKRLGKQGQFQMGYKGFIQLAQRSGLYRTINATDVREGELLEEDMLSGEIKFKKLPSDKRVNAKVIGYAAFFALLNGFTKTIYMSKEEIDAHALKYSQSYRNDKYGTSLWKTQFDVMAKKTVIKALLSKFGPLTIEMQRAQQFDQSVIRTDDPSTDIQDIDAKDITYIDNQSDPVDAQAPEATEADKSEAKKTRNAVMEAAAADFGKANGDIPDLNLES